MGSSVRPVQPRSELRTEQGSQPAPSPKADRQAALAFPFARLHGEEEAPPSPRAVTHGVSQNAAQGVVAPRDEPRQVICFVTV